jgi:hypothetical protein
MRPFLLFQGSRPGIFYDVSTGDSYPRRILLDKPFDFTVGHEPFGPELKAEWLGAAVSPTDTS